MTWQPDTLDASGCACGYATVAVDGLRLRAAPAAGAEILGVWPQGARVLVWAQQTDGWWLVEAADGGPLGWSFAPGYVTSEV